MPIEFVSLQKTDAKIICQSWGGKAENFTYLSAPILSTESLAQYYIDSTLANAGSLAFHIVGDGATVGLIKALVDGHRAQIGYVIDEAFWGKGYASLAVKFIVEKIKMNASIQGVWETCALENAGSRKVLEKNGFIREGVLKNWIVYPAQGSQAHDNYVYSYPLS